MKKGFVFTLGALAGVVGYKLYLKYGKAWVIKQRSKAEQMLKDRGITIPGVTDIEEVLEEIKAEEEEEKAKKPATAAKKVTTK